MALKGEVETLDGVPEALHEHYVQEQGSGKYVLAVDGFVPKARVDEFRNTNINLAKERDKLKLDFEEFKKGFGELTPEQVAEMKKQLEGIKDKKILDDEGIEALLEKRLSGMKLEHEGQLKALNKRIGELSEQADTWSGKYRKTVIDRAISDAAIKAGVRPSAIVDVVLRGQSMWTLNEQGKPVAKDQNGEILYGKDGSTPLSPLEWMDSLKGDAPHFFEPSGGGGAAGNNGAGGPGKIKVRSKADLKTAADKSAFIQDHGLKAFEELPRQ
jgi:hypothetical protein